MKRIVTLLGFAMGAFAAYRWIMGRLAVDAAVDAAPPIEHPPAVPA